MADSSAASAPDLTPWQRQMAESIASATPLHAAGDPLFQAMAGLMTAAEARMPKVHNRCDPRHAVRAGNLKPTQVDSPDDLLDMLDEHAEQCKRYGAQIARDADEIDDPSAELWVRILATIERMHSDRDLMTEALELVALTPKTRGVYVLDEQDMVCVRRAAAKAQGVAA